MLVTENGKLLESQAGERPLPRAPLSDAGTSDPPPAYSDSHPQPTTPRSDVPSPSPSTSGSRPVLRPTNYIRISQKHASLKSEYTVDPSLVIPASLLPALGEGENQRKNFKATTTHATMHVNVRLQTSASARAGATDDKKQLRLDDEPISVELNNSQAPITARIVDALPSPRRKLQILVSTSHAKITLYLPHSFNGPLTAGTGNHMSIAFSEALQPYVTPFSERDFFIGDMGAYSALSESEQSSENRARLMDTAELQTTHSKILVKWDHEYEEDQVQANSGGFFRFLGF